jgi:hypothetical protein
MSNASSPLVRTARDEPVDFERDTRSFTAARHGRETHTSGEEMGLFGPKRRDLEDAFEGLRININPTSSRMRDSPAVAERVERIGTIVDALLSKGRGRDVIAAVESASTKKPELSLLAGPGHGDLHAEFARLEADPEVRRQLAEADEFWREQLTIVRTRVAG